jgi:hypothetical protein
MDRRQWLLRTGALVAAGAVPAGFAWNARADRRSLNALWFEWNDGYVYQHDCVVDGEGLWIDEHDGFMYFYEEFELADGGVWLTSQDGQSRFFECLTDKQAGEHLVDA